MNLGSRLNKAALLLLSMIMAVGVCSAQTTKRYKVEGGSLIDTQANVNLLEEASLGSDSTRNAIRAMADTLSRAEKRAIIRESKVKDPFITFNDSMPLSRVSWLSVPLPGFSQIYNKQAYKLPILYGVVGATSVAYVQQNKLYKEYKDDYDYMVARNASRTDIDPVQTKMIRHNTYRQLLLAGAISSYMYFIGDGALNYKYEVSSIKKATTLSTIFPGAGQFYNKSFWKVPIVLGSFATMGYVIDFNSRGYTRFKTAYDLLTDGDDETVDEFGGKYSESVISNLRDSYRRNRDLSIIATAGLYLLNIIDAHVDAHLKDYDISDDLASFSISPTLLDTSGSSLSYGITLSYSF